MDISDKRHPEHRMWKHLFEMWKSGYCLESVEYAHKTWADPNAQELRVAFIKAHVVEGCQDCAFANRMKAAEAAVAKELLTTQEYKDWEDGMGEALAKHPLTKPKWEGMARMFADSLPPHQRRAFSKWLEVTGKRPPLYRIYGPEGRLADLAPFRIPGGDSKKALFLSGRDLVVEMYLTTLDTLRTAQTVTAGGSVDIKPEELKRGNYARWGLLNQAHIFEVPVNLYSNLYHLADRMTTELGGWKWTSPLEEDLVHPFENRDATKYAQIVKQHSKEMWPERFPFDVCYLALDPPLELNELQRSIYGVDSCESAWLYAFLVTASGEVDTFINVVQDDRAGIATSMERYAGSDTWHFYMSLSPWTVTWMVDWINDHQVTIEEKTGSFRYRDHYKKATKRLKVQHIPSPYYVITMREDLLHEKERQVMSAPRKHWELQYRHDVRGCNNCRIMRGPLPLDPKLERMLRRDKRRKIYTTELPDAETSKELMKRGISPKHRDEWLAVLLYWRKDHIKGPPDAPFIPAIRRSARRRKTTGD